MYNIRRNLVRRKEEEQEEEEEAEGERWSNNAGRGEVSTRGGSEDKVEETKECRSPLPLRGSARNWKQLSNFRENDRGEKERTARRKNQRG